VAVRRCVTWPNASQQGSRAAVRFVRIKGIRGSNLTCSEAWNQCQPEGPHRCPQDGPRHDVTDGACPGSGRLEVRCLRLHILAPVTGTK
jgi:hypothetical protein